MDLEGVPSDSSGWLHLIFPPSGGIQVSDNSLSEVGKRVYSLIVSTLGRSDDVRAFLESVERQYLFDGEVIIVDQNNDDRVAEAIRRTPWSFPLKHIRVPLQRGLSAGRNEGIKASLGDVLCFPDDDCIYPPDIFQKVDAILAKSGADFVCGRPTNLNGKVINGRFLRHACWIKRNNVFETQIEWIAFFKAKVLKAVDGYDIVIGVGANSPWQACEGQDIALRALSAGFKGWYDPQLTAHHPELYLEGEEVAILRKIEGYGRGMGFVLARHKYGLVRFMNVILRPLAGAVISLFRLDLVAAKRRVVTAKGRCEGYIGGLSQLYKANSEIGGGRI